MAWFERRPRRLAHERDVLAALVQEGWVKTVNWVVAGAIAKQILPQIKINAYVSSVGSIVLDKFYDELNLDLIETNPVRCPDPSTALEMETLISKIKKEVDGENSLI